MIKVHETRITGIYISPKATAEKELEILNHVNRIGKGRAIIMGYVIARHLQWDRKSNGRGRRLVKYASKNRWKIRPPKGLTFAVKQIGNNTIDLAKTKGLLNYVTTTTQVGTFKGSDHQPIITTILTAERPDQEKGRIPKKTRALLRLSSRATEIIKTIAPSTVKEVGQCDSIEKLHRCYDKMCRAILAPWDQTRVVTSDKFKPGWSWTMDHKARLRCKYYRKAKVRNEKDA